MDDDNLADAAARSSTFVSRRRARAAPTSSPASSTSSRARRARARGPAVARLAVPRRRDRSGTACATSSATPTRFVRRDVFARVGGFTEDFGRRLRRLGILRARDASRASASRSSPSRSSCYRQSPHGHAARRRRSRPIACGRSGRTSACVPPHVRPLVHLARGRTHRAPASAPARLDHVQTRRHLRLGRSRTPGPRTGRPVRMDRAVDSSTTTRATWNTTAHGLPIRGPRVAEPGFCRPRHRRVAGRASLRSSRNSTELGFASGRSFVHFLDPSESAARRCRSRSHDESPARPQRPRHGRPRPDCDGGGRFLHVGPDLDRTVAAYRRRAVDATGLTTHASTITEAWRLPHADRSFDLVCAYGILDDLADPVRAHAFDELLRVTRRGVLLHASGRSRERWEAGCLRHACRKHPLHQVLVPYEGLDWLPDPSVMLFERLARRRDGRADRSRTSRPGRDLHMDMLREARRRADAHVARYMFARQFIRTGDRVLDAACGLGYGGAILADGTLARVRARAGRRRERHSVRRRSLRPPARAAGLRHARPRHARRAARRVVRRRRQLRDARAHRRSRRVPGALPPPADAGRTPGLLGSKCVGRRDRARSESASPACVRSAETRGAVPPAFPD